MNADGLTGYDFSHEGFWSGGISTGTTDDAKKCADECDKFNQCIAFSYQSDDKGCFLSYTPGANTLKMGNSRAYLKCTGMYEQCQEIYCTSKIKKHLKNLQYTYTIVLIFRMSKRIYTT